MKNDPKVIGKRILIATPNLTAEERVVLEFSPNGQYVKLKNPSIYSVEPAYWLSLENIDVIDLLA